MSSSTVKLALDYESIASAYHEASHAIISLVNLIKVDDVNIITKTYNCGLCNYSLYKDGNVEDIELANMIALAEVRLIYAGLVGEKIYYKNICGSDKFPMILREGSSQDTLTASKLIRKYRMAYSGNQTKELKDCIKKELKNKLLDHWEDVQLLAHLLYKKKKVFAVDIKNLLTRKSPNKVYWKNVFKCIRVIYASSTPEESVVKNLMNLQLALAHQ